SGIQAVLDELLDRACGPLDHLSRRHLAGENFGQNVDVRHEAGSTELFRRSKFQSEKTPNSSCSFSWVLFSLVRRSTRRMSSPAMISSTDRAAAELKKLLESKGAAPDQGLRLGVRRG